jgi:hypothetical protein
MTALITLITSTALIGPFNIYSNVDGFLSAFASGITRDKLTAGYGTDAIPTGTTIIRVMSTGICTNFIDIPFSYNCALTGTAKEKVYDCIFSGTADEVPPITSSTSTSTSTSSTSTTTTTVQCNITSPIKLSYSGDSGAIACSLYDVNTAPTYYTFNNASFATTDQLNETPLCTRRAGVGYYSDGIISRYFNANGNFGTPVACADITSTTTTTTSSFAAGCNLYDISAARATVDPGNLSYLSCEEFPVLLSLDIIAGSSHVICTSDTINSYGEVDVTRLGSCEETTTTTTTEVVTCSYITFSSAPDQVGPSTLIYRMCDDSGNGTITINPGDDGAMICIRYVISVSGPGSVFVEGVC